MVASERLVYGPSGRPLCESSPRFFSISSCDLGRFPQTQDFILSVDGKTVEEDTRPSLEKIYPISDGFMVQSITGVRTRIVSRLDGKGYDVAKCQFLSPTRCAC